MENMLVEKSDFAMFSTLTREGTDFKQWPRFSQQKWARFRVQFGPKRVPIRVLSLARPQGDIGGVHACPRESLQVH